jgi:UDP-N-acetylmuramate--alanine ligase
MKSMNELKLLKGKKFHFIGIGGISMSALALMLKKNGYYVQGSDEVVNSEMKKLAKRKVRVFLGHTKNNVLGVDVVVYSSAIRADNPELVYAKNNKLIILKRAELLGLLAETYKTVIAVAGSHGKTTATAMISEMFEVAGLKPTVHIGGKLNSIKSNFKIGNKKYFITENCEYKDNFFFVKPDISVVLNIDSDHLDYFKTLENIKFSFMKYVKNTKDGGINIFCANDDNSREIACLDNCATFGFSEKSDIQAKNIQEYKSGYYKFDVVIEKCKLGNIKLNIIGRHNVFNALACILVGLICDIDFEVIKNAIENFSGVERRSEFVGTLNGAKIYHDYAHHTKQIEKMICSANELLDKQVGRVITIFEPHTFSRTKFLIEEFAKSFSGSDFVFFAPVYSAREDRSEGLSSKELLSETKKFNKNCELFDDYKDIVLRVKNECQKGDIILVLGAGNIEKLAKMLIE